MIYFMVNKMKKSTKKCPHKITKAKVVFFSSSQCLSHHWLESVSFLLVNMMKFWNNRLPATGKQKQNNGKPDQIFDDKVRFYRWVNCIAQR